MKAPIVMTEDVMLMNTAEAASACAMRYNVHCQCRIEADLFHHKDDGNKSCKNSFEHLSDLLRHFKPEFRPAVD
jgi:hypothetical protein